MAADSKSNPCRFVLPVRTLQSTTSSGIIVSERSMHFPAYSILFPLRQSAALGEA
jgi:hypothetical protein